MSCSVANGLVYVMCEHSAHPAGAPSSLNATWTPFGSFKKSSVSPAHADPGTAHVPTLTDVRGGTGMVHVAFLFGTTSEKVGHASTPGGGTGGEGGGGPGGGGGELAMTTTGGGGGGELAMTPGGWSGPRGRIRGQDRVPKAFRKGLFRHIHTGFGLFPVPEHAGQRRSGGTASAASAEIAASNVRLS